MNKNCHKIHLVLFDMIMPKMDGKMTFDLIRELCPSVPVILTSGYSIDGQAPQNQRKVEMVFRRNR